MNQISGNFDLTTKISIFVVYRGTNPEKYFHSKMEHKSRECFFQIFFPISKLQKIKKMHYSLVHLWFDPEQIVTSDSILFSKLIWVGYSRKKSIEKYNGRNPIYIYGLLRKFSFLARRDHYQLDFWISKFRKTIVFDEKHAI